MLPGGSLGPVYKAVWYVDEAGNEYPKLKMAGVKSTWPGKKEISRHPHWEEDVIQLAHEPRPPNYQRLLRPMMRKGEMVAGSPPPLSEIRERAQNNVQQSSRLLDCRQRSPLISWLSAFMPTTSASRSASDRKCRRPAMAGPPGTFLEEADGKNGLRR
jgi:hypothetical protein